ncbi:MAG: hypothetical protein DRN27_02505 [Thermoplasmata archaeon]|nr:MAG: hypothetical protein DRN27_02505 [Thermoplasmata archaeon]
MKRILYLDTLRGFLILYVIFIHAILLVIFQANYDYIDLLPVWLVALMIPMLLIAMWGPMFSMMSSTTNTIIVYHQLEKGKKLQKIIINRMISYSLIIVIHIINMFFFIHFIPLDGKIYRSLICGTLETGQITLPSIIMFLNSGTLLLIGLSGLLINIILLIIWRNNGHKNLIKTGYIFFGLTISFLFIRPFVYPSINTFILHLSSQNQNLIAIMLSWLFRGQFGLIPMAAFPFLGVIFGLLLIGNVKKQSIMKIGFGLTAGMLIFALLFIGLYGVPDLTLPYWPVAMVAVNLMIMVFVTTLLILRYKYSSEKTQEKIMKRSIFFRRFSMITLTIFVFESIIAVIWAKIFIFIFKDPFPFNVFADVLYLFCVISTWYIILRVWERFDFKYSIEWFMMKIISKINGKKSHKLDVKTVLYQSFHSEEQTEK